MDMEHGLKGQENWKAPATPERRRLVVDSRDATSHWESPSADVDDTLDKDGAQDVEEAQREEAIRLAELSVPSVDQVEQARLDELLVRSEQLTKAVASASPWKKLGGFLSSDSEYSRQGREIEKLRSEIRAQRDLVRELSYVIRNEDIDPIVPDLETIKKKQFWAMEDGVPEKELAEIRLEQIGVEKRLESAFHEIAQALGLSKSNRSREIPKTDDERESLRKSLEDAQKSGNKVQKKWAAVGLRLLAAYQKSNPTRKDSQTRMDYARAAEFERRGPMESTDGGKTWARMTKSEAASDSKPELQVPHDDSQGEEMAA